MLKDLIMVVGMLGFIVMALGFVVGPKKMHKHYVFAIRAMLGGMLILFVLAMLAMGVTNRIAKDVNVEFSVLQNYYENDLFLDEHLQEYVITFPDTTGDTFLTTSVNLLSIDVEDYNVRYKNWSKHKTNKLYGDFVLDQSFLPFILIPDPQYAVIDK